MVCILKFSKGHNSVNSIGGVMGLILSTSSVVFYICTKFCQSRFPHRFQSYGPKQ